MSIVAPLSFDDSLLRQLLESMSEGVSLATPEGVIVYANPAEEQMYGYATGELIGRRVSELHAGSPSESARLMGEVAATLQRGGEWRGERRNRRKNGGEFFSRARISSVKVSDADYWLCVQEDISGRRSEDAALKESEGRLALAAAAARIGVWDWDLVGGDIVYSDRAKAICGLPTSQPVTGKLIRAITHRQDYSHATEQVQRAIDPAIRDESPYEYRIVRPDGAVRWIKAHGVAVFADGADGPKPVRYVGTLEDITEQRQVEEELRRSRARLTLAIDAGRMAVWSIDAETEEFVRTPELNRVLGFPEEARPTLEDIRNRYAPGELDRVRAEVQAALQRGDKFFEIEFRYLWPEGELRWLLLRADIAFNPAGMPLAAIGVVIDITERKEAEERLKLLAREVDHRANNLLTVVQATVTLTRAPDARSLKEILTGRISALAHAHQLLAQARWQGADLRQMVEEELRPYQLGDGGRVPDPGPYRGPAAAGGAIGGHGPARAGDQRGQVRGAVHLGGTGRDRLERRRRARAADADLDGDRRAARVAAGRQGPGDDSRRARGRRFASGGRPVRLATRGAGLRADDQPVVRGPSPRRRALAARPGPPARRSPPRSATTSPARSAGWRAGRSRRFACLRVWPCV